MGKTVRMLNDLETIKAETQDYIKCDIIIYSCSFRTSSTSHIIIPILSDPVIHHTFTRDEQIDFVLLHRRLTYTSENRIKEIYKHETLKYVGRYPPVRSLKASA